VSLSELLELIALTKQNACDDPNAL